MTEKEVIDGSKDRPDEWILWMGDRIDSLPDRDEALFRLGQNLTAGGDAYGHETDFGVVYHAGRKIAAGTRDKVGGVHFERIR